MTASGRLYFLLALAALPFAASWLGQGWAKTGFAFDIALLIALIADFNLTQRPHLISATREVADRLSIGRANKVCVQVLNKGNSPLTVRVKDSYPDGLDVSVEEFQFGLGGRQEATLNYDLTPRRRGAYRFGPVNIRYLSFLGLFWRQVTSPADQEVKVFSDLKSLTELSIKLSHSTELGELHMRKRGQGTDFSSLREYTVGDDIRRIDWRATARRDRPIVRNYEVEQEQTLLVLIDAGRMMVSDLEGLSRFDHALNAGLSLALAGLTRNDQVGLGIFADRPLLYLPPRRGKAHLVTMLEAVHNIEPRTVEPDYIGDLAYFASVQKGRSLMVVLTDLTDPTASRTLLTGLAGLAPRHLPFCVTLLDRQLKEQMDERSAELNSIYRRAVATDLINQREIALSHLTRRGCMVLDAPPQELSTQLVDRYLEIKARGAL